MKYENGKDIQKWMNLVDEINGKGQVNEESAPTTTKKGVDPVEKNKQNITDLQKSILEQKFQLLNAKIKDMYLQKNPEMQDNEMMKFDFVDKGDYYEFLMPLNVLFGPQTRKTCAEYWNTFFANCDIKADFADNIEEAVKKISDMHLTMKLVVNDGKVSEK